MRYFSTNNTPCFVQNLKSLLRSITLSCHFWRLTQTLNLLVVLEQLVVKRVQHFFLRFSNQEKSYIFRNYFLNNDKITLSVLTTILKYSLTLYLSSLTNIFSASFLSSSRFSFLSLPALTKGALSSSFLFPFLSFWAGSFLCVGMSFVLCYR